MKNKFVNTGFLSKFILEKERRRIPLWLFSMLFLFVLLGPLVDNIIDTTNNMDILIETMKNPAMIGMIGPVYVKETYTVGSMYVSYMFVYSAIILAVFNIFFVSEHTRKDEELGRQELLASLPVGRLSNLASVMVISFGFHLLLVLGMGFGLHWFTPQMSLGSALFYSLTLGLFGLLFSSLTAFLAQICTSNRTLLGLSFISLLLMYFLRAFGDVSWEVLSIISPLGLILRTKPFIENATWPIWILLAEIALLLFASFKIANQRDFGSGIIPEKAGKKELDPFFLHMRSLAWKLTGKTLILWSLVIFFLSAMYASMFEDMESYISSSELMKNMIVIAGEGPIMEQVLSMLLSAMAIISTIPGLLIVMRALSEEKKGLTEEVLSQSVSRYKYLNSFFLLAIISIVLNQVVTALGFWLVGGSALSPEYDFSTILHATFTFMPYMVLVVVLATFLIAFKPKYAWVVYLYLAYIFFLVYLGGVLDLPDFLMKLSNFEYSPIISSGTFSGEEFFARSNLGPLILSLGVAIGMMTCKGY